jgi:hypothetical protein
MALVCLQTSIRKGDVFGLALACDFKARETLSSNRLIQEVSRLYCSKENARSSKHGSSTWFRCLHIKNAATFRSPARFVLLLKEYGTYACCAFAMRSKTRRVLLYVCDLIASSNN